MAKTAYVDILPEFEEAFFTIFKSSDRFMFSRIVRKQVFYTRKSVEGLTAKSLLPQIAALWNGFSEYEKQAWEDAANIEKGILNPPVLTDNTTFYGVAIFGAAIYGVHITEARVNGWRLFVQDQSYRIKNGMSGVATPSLLHQSLVGNLKIESPATELQIIQVHPHFYWISRKVTGKKAMYEPVLITEDFAFPVTISLNYKSDLAPANGENFAKFYATFWYSYQGADQYVNLEIPLDYSAVWKNAFATLTTLPGYVIGYDLYFWLKGLQGDLYFDNVKVEHSGQNWVRDPFCQDVNQGFTRAFYQIPKHWAAVILPPGAIYDSIYKDF